MGRSKPCVNARRPLRGRWSVLRAIGGTNGNGFPRLAPKTGARKRRTADVSELLWRLFFRPSGAGVCWACIPRLAPWAEVCRRSAAGRGFGFVSVDGVAGYLGAGVRELPG
jgi:hypothetical protein